MPPRPFFPDPGFGWTFYAVLVGLLVAALYTDLRAARIPKTLSVILLALGLVFNVVRGAFQGSADLPLWWLPSGNAFLGIADAFLFSLAGFAVGFGLFFVMFVLGACGGGDVKLMAALGAWVGPTLVVFVMAASCLVMLLLTAGRMLLGGVSPSGVRARLKASSVSAKHAAKVKAGLRGKLLMTYAAPVAVATAVIMFWIVYRDLNLSNPSLTAPAQVQHAVQ
jgi:prepilin peptidase CpaA